MGNNEILNNVADIITHNDDINLMIHKVCDAFAGTGTAVAAKIITDNTEYLSENFSGGASSRSFSVSTPWGEDLTLELYLSSKADSPEADADTVTKAMNMLVGEMSKRKLQSLVYDNTERVKELNGINETANIIGKELSMKETLLQICNTIPSSWQYPEHTCVRITYENNEFHSKGFKESAWFIKETFVTLDNKKGTIQVYYTKKFPDMYDGPFLKEECRLLANISRLVCGYINNHKGREVFDKATSLVDTKKRLSYRETYVKDRQPLQLFFNKQMLDKYIYLDMMRYKVKNILFVSTLYDAFILESEDNFFGQFMGGEIYQFSLFSLPRTTAVTSSEEALDMLHTMKFDLVILMVGIDKKQPIELSKRIHRRYKNLPIYLLINQKDDIKHFEDIVPATNSIDKMFVWNGESQILFSIVKSIEDRANVENDTAVGLVRVILLIEDNSLYFSRYLQYLYSIVFNQIDQSLRDVDHNEINKISKMRSRPKILHASNYEDAMYFFEKYKNFLLCVISDAEFERNGTLDKNAGATFIRHVQSQMLSLPMILQSSDPENENVAKDLGVTFINKKSSSLFNDLKTFLISQLGFGDFIFRDATNGKPIAVARSLKEFLSILKYIPEQTIKMHSDENQFSLWLMSRGEIQLAKRVNPLLYSDFTSADEYRNKLLDLFNEYSEERNRGKILNFDDVNVVTERNIVSMSGGSFGGKGRGLAFINVLIYNTDFSKFTDDINICMPKTVIIGTDEFDYFMKENNLYEFLAEGHTYMEIRERFVEARISEAIWTKLARFLTQTQKPLAVRSSSLSEDSLAQPFAGVFDTYVVPNNEDHKVELKQLSKAIKLVYASIFSDESKHYFDAIHRKVEEEKMAVVLEELVGRQHGNYYYPHISGTAQSYNYYPVAHMKPDEGFVNAAVGLGYYVVGGQKSFRFSPKYPNIDIFSPKELLKSTQTEFCALDVSKDQIDYLHDGEMAPIARLSISEAEKHGTIKHCASVYNAQNDNVEPGLSCPGPRIINFADILKYNYIPLPELLDEVLQRAQEAMGCPVEIEWAVDLDPAENGLPSLYLLQIKPMASGAALDSIDIGKPQKGRTLLYSENSLGNGIITTISDIIYVDPDKFDKMQTIAMVKEIEYLNNLMVEEDKKYLLVGPGRWGTRDQFLGIPVTWPQISNAKVIVEMSLPGFPLDSSLGSHFFHNVTSMNIGYFSIQDASTVDFINWDYIKKQKPVHETEFFRHVSLKSPMKIKMNGRERKAHVLRDKD